MGVLLEPNVEVSAWPFISFVMLSLEVRFTILVCLEVMQEKLFCPVML